MVLTPPVGENQKFVYIIIALGEDTSDYRELSHFVFEICPTLTEADMVNSTVIYPTGYSDEAFSWVVNDQQTQCTGVKYDFVPALDKVKDTIFKFSFELINPFPIGPVEYASLEIVKI